MSHLGDLRRIDVGRVNLLVRCSGTSVSGIFALLFFLTFLFFAFFFGLFLFLLFFIAGISFGIGSEAFQEQGAEGIQRIIRLDK